MKKIFLFLCLAAFSLSNAVAQKVDSFSVISFRNEYLSKITTAFTSQNYRSGFVFESTGSINMGIVGIKDRLCRFRWLAQENGPMDYLTGDSNQLMALDGWGNLIVKNGISIGVRPDTTRMVFEKYKLLVEGTIGARRVRVLTGAWPDYVFKSDYQLPSLQYVEQFIKEHEHLPEIPSAKEVKADGQDLGEMNRLLLQKVEELTLYIIQLNKRVDEQQEVISKLQQKH